MIDPHSGRARYLQRATGARSWRRPEAAISEAEISEVAISDRISQVEISEVEISAGGAGGPAKWVRDGGAAPSLEAIPPSLEAAAASQAVLSATIAATATAAAAAAAAATAAAAAATAATTTTTAAAVATSPPGASPPASLRASRQSAQSEPSQGNFSSRESPYGPGRERRSSRERRPSSETVMSAAERDRKARQESYMRRIRAQDDLHSSSTTGGAARSARRSSSLGSLALGDLADDVGSLDVLEPQPEGGDGVFRTSTGPSSGPHPSL